MCGLFCALHHGPATLRLSSLNELVEKLASSKKSANQFELAGEAFQ